MVGEDRCHLNGLAMDGERPAFVTAVSRSDVADGWRERRRDGGVVIDVASGEIVAAGLSMPHSPRLHDGRLWVLNSGRGELGSVDPATGALQPGRLLPRLCARARLRRRYAVIGLSRPRNNQTFEGLELDERLSAKDAAPRCGLLIVNIDTGDASNGCASSTRSTSSTTSRVLPGVAQAEAVGFLGEDIERIVRPA